MNEPTITTIDPRGLQTRPPFSDLLPVDSRLLESITLSMKEGGYDNSKPINVWVGGNVIVDGHTRRLAAIEAGVDVAVYFHDFKDEDEAFEYAVRCQKDRRNLTDADITRLVMKLDQRKKTGPNSLASHDAKLGKSAAATAEIIGTSETKVERTRTVLGKGDETVKQAVLDGKMTINKAYNLTQEKRKPKSPSAPLSLSPPAGFATADAASPPIDIAPSGHPSRERFNTLQFDEDAALRRAVDPILSQLRSTIMDTIGGRTPAAMSVLYSVLWKAVSVADVEDWTACRKCNGTGKHDGVCRACRGGGYAIFLS